MLSGLARKHGGQVLSTSPSSEFHGEAGQPFLSEVFQCVGVLVERSRPPPELTCFDDSGSIVTKKKKSVLGSPLFLGNPSEKYLRPPLLHFAHQGHIFVLYPNKRSGMNCSVFKTVSGLKYGSQTVCREESKERSIEE